MKITDLRKLLKDKRVLARLTSISGLKVKKQGIGIMLVLSGQQMNGFGCMHING